MNHLTLKLLVLLSLVISPILAQTNNPDGKEIFNMNCIDCHLNQELKAPSIDSLKMMSRESIIQSMESGIMKMQSSDLSKPEINAIAEYLQPIAPSIDTSGFCSGELSVEAGPNWTSWGNSLNQKRFQKESVSRINLGNISNLGLKWVFAVPETGRVRSQPSIAGGLLFFGS